MFFSTLKTSHTDTSFIFICYTVKEPIWKKWYSALTFSKLPSESLVFQFLVYFYFVTYACVHMLPLEKWKITTFTISYLVLLLATCFFAICGKMFQSARVFTAHQGSFLKSSKLVVISTCTLTNILTFQGVWELVIKVLLKT